MRLTFFSVVVTMLAIGLFAFGLFKMVDNIGRNNGGTQNILDDSQLSDDVDSLEGNLSGYLTDVNSADNSLSNSSIESGGTGDQRVVLQSLRGVPDVIRTSPTGMYDLSVGFIRRTLFSDAGTMIILTVISSIIALALIIAFVRWFITGQGGSD